MGRWHVRAVVLIALAMGASLHSLGIATHSLVNGEAAQSMFLQERLRAHGFETGLATIIESGDGERGSIQGWIEQGGELEDSNGRYLHHFHDPLKPWDQAGLDLGLLQFSSSIRWMHDQQGLLNGGDWSWREMRRLYYRALAERDPRRRDELWADLFRGLGQIMHLVVDASVPEHARNDMHPLGALRLRNSYERWVAAQHEGDPAAATRFASTYLSAPIDFGRDILGLAPPPGETHAAVPVARLVDADRYDGSNPGVTVGAGTRAPVSVGLAEIANANFFSEDTLGHQYPSPTTANLIEVNLPTPFGRVRRYFSRPAGQGLLPANPVRAECVTDKWFLDLLTRWSPYPCVDGLVWGQVAAHMLPRAVGYARGVLDYFFRGSMEVARVEWTRDAVEVTVKNTGPDVMEGVFEVYARLYPGTSREERVRLATLGTGEPIRIEPGEEWVDAIVIPPDAVPTPAHVLVFRGRLGLEADAVAAQVFTVPFVEVRQTSYDAETRTSCGTPLSTVTPPPYRRGETISTRQDTIRCEWPVVVHHVRGELVTNSLPDSRTGEAQPFIDRIEARWLSGRGAGPAPLIVDGVPVGGVWQRAGSEPDPASFEILEPAGRDKALLTLIVSYAAGSTGGSVEATLATFGSGVSVHSKSRWIDVPRDSSPPRYLVTSGRAVSGFVFYNWQYRDRMTAPLFEAVAIGGLAPGTDARTSRTFGGLQMTEGTQADVWGYDDSVLDDFEAFTDREDADGWYEAIALQGPHPDGPFFPWTAEVRRVYQSKERDFLRAFVTSTPDAYTIRLAGRAAGGSGGTH